LSPSERSPSASAWLRLLVRLGIAVGLTAYVMWQSEPGDVLRIAGGARWAPIVAAVLLVLLDRTLMAYRWVALLCTIEDERRPPLSALMRIFFVSTFVGTFLPASIGGDAVRSYSLARLNVPGGDAVASVFMDRILGFASLLLMSLAGLGLARQLTGNAAILTAIGLTAGVCAVTLLLVFNAQIAAIVSTLIRRLPSEASRRIASRLLESVRKYAAHPRVLVGVLICSLAVQVLRIVQAYCLGRSLGIAAPLTVYFAFLPVILIVMLIPVTFNGIGTGQAAFVWFFNHAGVPEPASFALSVLFIALGIVGNLPGAALYVAGRRQR
jgi:glycosyltransferase 2 family protein